MNIQHKIGQRQQRSLKKKSAIFSVTVPPGFPGNTRFMLPESIGEVRLPAWNAGKFMAGTRMILPEISSSLSVLAKSNRATGPSYSSP
jgi:hypothetical protein